MFLDLVVSLLKRPRDHGCDPPGGCFHPESWFVLKVPKVSLIFIDNLDLDQETPKNRVSGGLEVSTRSRDLDEKGSREI